MVTRTSEEVRTQIADILEAAKREPVAITSNGQTAGFVISPRDMKDLQLIQEAKRKRLAAEWSVWSETARKNMKPESAELTEEDIVRLVHELR